MSPDLLKLIFGRLTFESLPLHEPIVVGTFAVVATGGLIMFAGLTYFRLWGYLWSEWFTSVDHKRIGIMYMILGIVMLLRGFADALMMRLQQALAFGGSEGYLNSHHYDQVFTAHGVIMIFFVAMPLVTGLMNFVVPLQIGARDVSFPFLNNFSFWMTVGGAVLVMASLFIGEFARTGWLAYPPLSNIGYSPDVGVDYYIWGLQVAGVGTTLSGINLICTIVKLRCPGMTMMRMPVFTWTALCTNVLIVALLPGSDRRARAAFARPLRRHQLLHERFRRQPDDVREPDLDLGSSRGLHPGSPRLRHLLRGDLDLLRQAAVRLHLNGLRHCRHHHPVVPGLAAPLLHDGVGRQRQLVLRHHHDDHLDPDGREDVQLAVHDVSRPHPLRAADDVDDRVHADLRARRHDRRAAGGAAGRLPSCTTACS
ncbi:hypothetical protein ACVW0I_008308 [Bradyrhizobium sp. LM6.11]